MMMLTGQHALSATTAHAGQPGSRSVLPAALQPSLFPHSPCSSTECLSTASSYCCHPTAPVARTPLSRPLWRHRRGRIAVAAGPPAGLLEAEPDADPQGAQAASAAEAAEAAAAAVEAEGFQSRDAVLEESIRRDANVQVHMVQWYPGHIAKAERQLKEQLKMVDVVMEVRDARIPIATNHPQVPQWVGSKPCLLVMNRVDMITQADRRTWAAHFKATKQDVVWTDGQRGAGAPGLKSRLLKVSKSINEKRAKRGLQPRPVRACVIGFPNIGKSALINRLINRRAVASAPKPGVTRLLQWVRLSGELDLLDAPGVIPASFNDQIAAQRLAICNDIGEASYIDSLVAAALVIRCKLLPTAPQLLQVLHKRYGVDPLAGSAEDFIVGVADRMFCGDTEKAGSRILKDYRTGALGKFALELPLDLDKKQAREAAAAAAAAPASCTAGAAACK
mmetsp:Transcript_15033/g.40632  ORF Transcript_15033/g.40632 Transcript_15033/m.40632 type:complete len:449 (-) Transcript_15033:226-1572(-)